MTKISDLPALTGAGVDTAADLFPIVDMSAAGALRNKKITIDEAKIALGVGAPIAELDDLPDVNAPTPSNGDVLTWDSTPGEWVASAPASGIAELDDIPDVNAPTPANGDVLTWDSTPGEWVASAPAGAGAFDLDDATDVNAPSPSNGDVLTWDSTPGEWVAQAPGGGSGAWTHIETLSPSAVASIDSEAWAGGSYKQLCFVLQLEVVTDATGIGIQYKLNGAYKTAANYLMAAMHCASNGTNSTEDDAGATQGHIVETHATWGAGNQALEFLDGELRINYPFNTARAKRWKFNGGHGGPSGIHIDITASGIYTGTDNAMALEGVRFLGVGTNITGVIDVYGLS